MIRPLHGTILAVTLASALAACATRRPPRPPRPISPPAPPGRSLSGVVDFEVLRDPSAPSVKPREDQDYQAPQLLEGAGLPPYPEELLPLALPEQEVTVRIVVGEQGQVVTAVPSPLDAGATPTVSAAPPGASANTAGEHRPRFQEAALAAVRRWQFTPPRIRTFRPGEDCNGDGQPDSQVLDSETPIRVFLDLRFRFSVVDGKGVVEQVESGARP